MEFLYNIFGSFMKAVYQMLTGIGSEPSSISYFAMTIMAMAVLSKLLTLPLTIKQGKASQKMQQIRPQLEEIKRKYGYDERIMQQKTMEFYKENNVSQVGCSSCLPLIIQLIIIIALFQVLRNPENYLFDNAQEFQKISKNFFWIQDLSKADPYFYALPLFNGLSQFVTQWLSPSTQQQAAAAGNSMMMMMYIMPVMIFFLSLNWASALLLYWAFGNLLEIIVRGGMMLFGRRRLADSQRSK